MTHPRSIPLLVPQLPDRQALTPYLDKIDLNHHYSNFGPLNQALEARLATVFEEHASHAIHITTTSSATLGLELTLSSLMLPLGSKIIVPALTFVATLTAIIRAGHVPPQLFLDGHSAEGVRLSPGRGPAGDGEGPGNPVRLRRLEI